MGRILVVDDAFLARRNLIKILKEMGHKVIGEAANGMEALAKYEKLNPDLVTMDITMPVLDGIHAVKEIIAKFPEAKIVMVSAVSQKEPVFEALRSGAKHFIIKPFKPEKVVEVINSCLGLEPDEEQSFLP